jgi:hypothetical protein
MYASLVAGSVRTLELDTALSLEHPLALRLLRYVDKKRHDGKPIFKIGLRQLCELHLRASGQGGDASSGEGSGAHRQHRRGQHRDAGQHRDSSRCGCYGHVNAVLLHDARVTEHEKHPKAYNGNWDLLKKRRGRRRSGSE